LHLQFLQEKKLATKEILKKQKILNPKVFAL